MISEKTTTVIITGIRNRDVFPTYIQKNVIANNNYWQLLNIEILSIAGENLFINLYNF